MKYRHDFLSLHAIVINQKRQTRGRFLSAKDSKSNANCKYPIVLMIEEKK